MKHSWSIGDHDFIIRIPYFFTLSIKTITLHDSLVKGTEIPFSSQVNTLRFQFKFDFVKKIRHLEHVLMAILKASYAQINKP